MVDPWEAIQPEYQPTAVVLDHIAHEINAALAPTCLKPAHVMLLGGSDLLQSMSQPGVWSLSDLDHILGTYGIFVIERSGSVVADALAPLREWSERRGKTWVENIHVVRQLIANDISSTRIRQFLRQGMSVQYLLPTVVIEYIHIHRLYCEHEEFRETRSSSMPPLCRLKGKEKGEGESEGKCGVNALIGTEKQLLATPATTPKARSSSALRERTRLWGTAGVDAAVQTDPEVTVGGYNRGRRPS